MTVKRIVVGGSMETNCYICCDEATGRCAIIDPGDVNEELTAAIEEAGKEKFDYILLTHCHYDHVGGVSRVKDMIHAPIAIYKDDEAGLREPLVNRSGVFGRRSMLYPSPDITFSDGDTFKVGETAFTVLHTPGHTAGSCCYLIEGKIFAGDTLFRESIGRTDMPSGNPRQMEQSLRKLIALPGDYVVYPGHYELTTLSHERASNPYMQLLSEN